MAQRPRPGETRSSATAPAGRRHAHATGTSDVAGAAHVADTTHVARAAHVAGIVTTGLFALFTTRLVVRASAVPPAFHVLMWVAIAAAAVVTLLFLTATVSARTTRAVGRILLIVASSLGIAYTVSFTAYTYFHGPAAYGAGDTTTAVAQLLLGITPSAVTLLATTLTAPARSHRGTPAASSVRPQGAITCPSPANSTASGGSAGTYAVTDRHPSNPQPPGHQLTHNGHPPTPPPATKREPGSL